MGLLRQLARVQGLSAELGDVVYELQAYLDELEADPNRLETVEDRLQALRALERKYGEDVEGYLTEAKARLARMENFEEETAELEGRIREGEAELEKLGNALSAGRERAARELSGKVQANLGDLNLGRTTFRADLVEGTLGPNGKERAEFRIQPNPENPSYRFGVTPRAES